VGVPDGYRGEVVKAFVVLKDGARTTEADLIAHCRGLLSTYKLPRAVELRDHLPTSGAGKLLRRALREA
jgi:long-chain acyl-CoA synthetase